MSPAPIPPIPHESEAVGPASAPARTGTEAVVAIAPFRVSRVTAPTPWDPEAVPLGVEWAIQDPNRRIRRGRVVYRALDFDGVPAVVKTVTLTADQLTPGVAHRLLEADCWDGTLPPSYLERGGSRITADLGVLSVTIEVWDTDQAAPGSRTERGDGRTARAGEWLARLTASVDIDAIVSAEWSRPFCIPYPLTPTLDDEERALGDVTLRIRVKNVLEQTSVNFWVGRIADPADPLQDYLYVSTQQSAFSEDDAGAGLPVQPGLHHALVQGGEVRLPDGALPFVRFNVYQEHWAYPGNNFYACRIGFGPRGTPQDASPRDPVADEARCLHMRFTVFIHSPANDLPFYRDNARNLHRFFQRQTRYFRSYLKVGQPADAERLLASYRHRYIVVFASHASCGCDHPEHPRLPAEGAIDAEGAEHVGLGRPLELLHEGFDPDQDICPPPHSMDEQGRQQLARLEQDNRSHYWRHWYPNDSGAMSIGWCLQREGVAHYVSWGTVAGLTVGRADLTSVPDSEYERGPAQGGRGIIYVSAAGWLRWYRPGETPRLFFLNDGCRGMLTTNFGTAFFRSGTRFYHGWHYSPQADADLVMPLFRRWILGGPGEHPAVECDPDRLEAAYAAVAATPYRASFFPRLMKDGARLPAGTPPAAASNALT